MFKPKIYILSETTEFMSLFDKKEIIR